jgi:hypothetical protein
MTEYYIPIWEYVKRACFFLTAAQAQYCCPEYPLGAKVESAEAPATPWKQREKSRSPSGDDNKKQKQRQLQRVVADRQPAIPPIADRAIDGAPLRLLLVDKKATTTAKSDWDGWRDGLLNKKKRVSPLFFL